MVQAVTINEFISTMAEVSGRDFKQFMLWYERSGTPSIAVSGTYDKKKCSYSLTFKQISAKSTKDSSSSESNYATVAFSYSD